MDFVSDSLESGRRIRILTILDLWDRSTPALEVDISLSGQWVVQVLERLRLHRLHVHYASLEASMTHGTDDILYARQVYQYLNLRSVK